MLNSQITLVKTHYETINSIYRKLKNKSFIAIKPSAEIKKESNSFASSEIIYNFAPNKLVE